MNCILVKRYSAPNGALPRHPPFRLRRTLGTVVAILACAISAIFYSMEWSGTVRAGDRRTGSRQTQSQCFTNSFQTEEALHSIPAEKSFTPIAWLSSTPAPINPRDSQRVRCAGPDTLLDESDEATCFSFSGGYGGVTLVSNSSRHRISHFTLDNSPVNGAIDPKYYPMGGSLWGLLEGELPVGLDDVVVSPVSAMAAYILLGSFCFIPEVGHAQTYATEELLSSREGLQFSVFYLEISSNWGGSHTCVSRLRFHELSQGHDKP